ncbi:sugar-binding domain protein, partial [Brevibacillus borstelensis]|uniref:sugar-binding domain protein n=1 Tax=Brevibacillus borstelensis TaxID=45462 RepID=UPI003D217E46
MNKKLVLSVLSTAVLTSMAASAMALEPGFYVGGNVDKYYSPSALAGNFKVAVKEVLKQPTVYVDKDGKAANFVEALFADDINTVLKPATADMFEDDDYKIVGTDKVWNKKDEPWPLPGDLKVESVSAITKTKIQVKFNKAIDAAEAKNFTIAGATVDSANLGEDKKTVTLNVSGLNYETEYTIVAKELLVDGKTVDSVEVKFKTPAVTDLYNLELETNVPGDAIRADGLDNLIITAKLKNKVTGEVDKNADNVVIHFSATFGNLANDRVTVQDGIAQVALTSEISDKDLVAKVDAQIIEASGDYKDLIGKVVGTKEVYFKLNIDPPASDAIPALLSVTSTSADRVTAYFDKDVTVADFLQYDKATDKVLVDDSGKAKLKEGVTIKVSQDANFADLKTVRGLKPSANNPKALEIVLEKDAFLEDNKEVYVEITQPSSTGDNVIKKNFVLVDTRKPEATSAVAENLNTVVVKFSKPIDNAKYTIDGGLIAIDETDEETGFGEFNAETREDKRHLLTLKTVDFMPAGTHSVQLAAIKDYAGKTDPNNISANQSLNFEVKADVTVPSADVSVESPEQFRVNFNKQIVGLDDAENRVDPLTTDQVQLQVLVKLDNGNSEWKTVESTNDDVVKKYAKDDAGKPILPTLAVQKVSRSEYVFELETDWTRIYDTKNTNKNYYNDQYRLHIPAGAILNPANGKKNEEINLLLNDPIMKAPDTTSPVIKNITKVDRDTFHVEMSKPVKLPVDGEPDTPRQDKETPKPTVEFTGKDKNGEYVTIKGIITEYATKDHKDTTFVAKVDETYKKSIQDIVNDGGDTHWRVAVSSISDDVGNTAATVYKDFIVEPDEAVEETFKVADSGIKGYLNGDKEDTIEIVFTSDVKITGTIGNALSPSNYTVNGVTLPEDTIITFTEAGKPNPAKNKITINLPDGTLSPKYSNSITLSKYLVSSKGIKLTGNSNFTFYVVDKPATDTEAPVVTGVKDGETYDAAVTPDSDATDIDKVELT